MTIWEKTILNMQKGANKITAVAAVFSERVKAEIAIVRLRVRIDETQALINEQYQTIGRKVETLKNSGSMPKSSEQLLKDEDISVALQELIARRMEIEELKNEIRSEQEVFKPASKHTEETTT